MYHRKVALIAALVAGIGSTASGQSSQPAARLTIQGPAEQAGITVKDALGKPCLDIEAAARPETINPDMLEHVVSLKNNCSRLIKVKLCYYNSEQCKQFDVQGYRRVDTTLGVMKGVKFFRYSLTQK